MLSTTERYIEIESKVQDYYEVASADWLLLEELIDRDGRLVHRAIRSDQRIALAQNSLVLKYMRNLYETSSLVVSYKPETAYQEDCSRGYLGIKVRLNLLLQKLVLGLSGLVTECPSDIDSTAELNFSVFTVILNLIHFKVPFLLLIIHVALTAGMKRSEVKMVLFQ